MALPPQALRPLRPAPPRRRLLALGVLMCAAAWALPGCGQPPADAPRANPACMPNQCQLTGTLLPDGSCRYTNKADGSSCDDNNSCTLYDVCRAGVCTGGTKLKDGAPCDDKNVCTQTDSCQAGLCVGSNPLVCPEGDACHEGGTCDPRLGCTLKSYGPCVVGLAAVPLQGCVQSDYYAPMVLGGQSFALLLDSGSTTTAVAMASCANCRVDPVYTPGPSATDQRRTAQAAYDDSTGWLGEIYLDTAQLGAPGEPFGPAVNMRFVGIKTDKSSSPNALFFSGSTCSGGLDPNAYQGILGLGKSDLALDNTDGFLDLVGARGTLTYDAFAVSTCDVGGRAWLGGFDPAAATRAPDFTPWVTRSAVADYYTIALDDVLVGKTSVGLAAAALGPAIVDTGTAAYTMSPQAFAAITQRIEADPNFRAHFGTGFFQAGLCVSSRQGADVATVDAALPPLTLSMPSGGRVNGMQVTLRPTQSYLQAQRAGASIVFCSTLVPADVTILGSAMMRGSVVVFDRENEQVGFAPRAPEACTSALPVAPGT